MKETLYGLLLLAFIACKGQKKEDNIPVQENNAYIIGDYQIDPKNKTVARYGMTGGVNWDGFMYTVDPKINFDTTALIFIGQHVFVKEDLPKDCNFDAIEVIKSDDRLEIFSDQNKIYTYMLGSGFSSVDISSLKKLRNNIYLDPSGDLVLLTGDYELRLARIQQPNGIDLNTVEYIASNYIKDKNGLYLCPQYGSRTGMSTAKLTKVSDGDGTISKSVVTKNYFTYGKKVFATTTTPLEMKLDETKMWEIFIDEYSNFSILTDGKNAYENERYGYTGHDPKIKFRMVNALFFEGINIKYVFSNELTFIPKNKSDLLFTGANNYENKNLGFLIQTSKSYYRIPFRFEAKKINKVFIYNIDTKKEEELKKEDFHYLKNNIYIYKNRLFSSGRPVYTTMNIKSIRLLYKGDIKTNFISDGKKVMCIGNRTGYSIKKINDVEFVLAEENSISDFSKLKIVNENVLIDDKNIYNIDICTPIEKLGLQIKTF
ncbi:hypothetical protein GKZ90_0005325 [Flavobacterium sp. MC2016-06]|jgi:hypothetical protein|uniref:hypothetical protein n=1 Tax=Flavobacterium sp. MC2016-06 TaxID=2676308 RepID=UPI0012BAD489|nr:hypothetical protein [Flavobacterium sp. MC2016-06]MBU3857557.1 hypothetical protein [Flavobacterium sp. MC2016-06]